MGLAAVPPDGVSSVSPDGICSLSPDGICSVSPDGISSAPQLPLPPSPPRPAGSPPCGIAPASSGKDCSGRISSSAPATPPRRPGSSTPPRSHSHMTSVSNGPCTRPASSSYNQSRFCSAQPAAARSASSFRDGGAKAHSSGTGAVPRIWLDGAM
eukprot:scaffold902_cov124-Isochrysis_galbana.AAC.1